MRHNILHYFLNSHTVIRAQLQLYDKTAWNDQLDSYMETHVMFKLDTYLNKLYVTSCLYVHIDSHVHTVMYSFLL